MRIGCLQFSPQVGDVDNNLNRADSVLSKANPDELDLLVLPEMAFSGYNFKSLQDITPFLEPSGSGITALWARTMALKYNCTVTVGYPEKVDVSPKWPTGPEYYNSAIVVNGDGETIANYRKSFLYYTAETWALEGPGFFDGFIPGLGNTSIGICMDLNPYRFEAPWDAFEFAFHVLEVESNLVIVSMAWMTREDRRHFTRMPNDPDMETLTYWVTRLEPLIRVNNQDEIIVVFCNRCGIEDDATYAGTSAVVGIQDGEVNVYGLLGRGEKELLVVDTNDTPYAKLVHRPSVGGIPTQISVLRESMPPAVKNNHASNASDASDKSQRSEGSSASQPSAGGTSADAINVAMAARSDTPKKRQPPAITIPQPEDLFRKRPSATSPNTYEIPTPSAPSPTPMALRPRLIIPESPSILPHQYPADHPMSAASLRSERSVRSDVSGMSTQTIRSNPRPPEESTPYPHSGIPLSGYPSNVFQDGKQIYGGHVTFQQQKGGLSPTTPFDDASPVSPGYYWRPHEDAFRGQANGSWATGTPIGKKPEPFPWSAIKEVPKDQPHPDKSATPNGTAMPTGNVHRTRLQHSQSPQSNSSNKTGQSTSIKKKTEEETARDKHPRRPSSPKSRNASRTGTRERPDSALGDHDVPATVAQRLEHLYQRTESVNDVRRDSVTESFTIDRPPSTKSRNCSRNRPNDFVDHQYDNIIQIAASPSVLAHGNRATLPNIDSRSSYRPPPRAGHQRSNSLTSGKRSIGYDLPKRSATPGTGSGIVRPASRAASRGRQPGPVPQSTPGISSPSARTRSTDTSRPGLLHSRSSRRSSHGQGSRNRRRSSSHQHEDLTNFERVELIVCPSCPAHGRASTSIEDNERREAIANQVPNQSTSEEDTLMAGPVTAPAMPTGRQSLPPHQVPLPLTPMSAPLPISSTRQQSNMRSISNERFPEANALAQRRAESARPVTQWLEASNYSSSADTIQTDPSPRTSPGTPLPFNPSTPKAMRFYIDNLDDESEEDPSSRDTTGHRYEDYEGVHHIDPPTSIVA